MNIIFWLNTVFFMLLMLMWTSKNWFNFIIKAMLFSLAIANLIFAVIASGWVVRG